MTLQLPLPLSLRTDLTFANFYSSKNDLVIAGLHDLLQAHGVRLVYLWGQGVGCTHLLQACCQQAAAQGLQVFYLSLKQLENLTPQLLENLEWVDLLCIDDLQAIAGNKPWEEAIFHLYNRSQNGAARLLFAASAIPKELGLQLPDLISRLTSGLIYQVHPLEDAEKIMVLQLRAKNVGLVLSEEVAQFLLHHLPRDLPALFSILEKLDHASLAQQRKLTIPFVKKVLVL